MEIDPSALLLTSVVAIPIYFRDLPSSAQYYARSVISELLEDFLAVEEAFSAARRDAGDPVVTTDQEAVDSLRVKHAGKLSVVLDLVVSQGDAA